MTIVFALALMGADGPPIIFGAPLPPNVVQQGTRVELDAAGRTVRMALFVSDRHYAAVKRDYRARFARTRTVRIVERREPLDVRFVLEPSAAAVRVLEVANMNFGASWDTVLVRALNAGTLIAVRERHPPDPVSGVASRRTSRIPRAFIEFQRRDALEDLRRD